MSGMCRPINGQEIFASVTVLTFVSQQSRRFLATIQSEIKKIELDEILIKFQVF